MTTRARAIFQFSTLLLALCVPIVHAAPAPQRPVDQFIVHYRGEAAATTASATRTRDLLLQAVGRAQGVRLQPQRALGTGAQVVRADRALDAEAAKRVLLQLQADPRVDYAQVDRWMAPAFTPNDTYFGQQWSLQGAAGGIRAPLAWDVSAGHGVVVGVVDTGVAAHPDLAANVVGGYDFITNPATAGDGDGRDASYADPGDFTLDGQCGFGIPATASSWHGTKMAGAIAAVANNSTGIAGVAFNGRVLALRALGRCGGRISDIADAIVWASGGSVAGVPANATPAEVINLSFSGLGSCDPALQAAIDSATGAGAVVVAAAGNRSADVAGETPGSCANVVAVGASDAYGGLAGYSNRGAGVDLVAPGGVSSQTVHVLSNSGMQAPASAIIANAQGTSLAAAHVSGVAALMQALQANSPATVEAILRGTARKMPYGCGTPCGTGIVDASMAVRAVHGPVVFMIDPPSVVEGDSGTKSLTFTLRLSQALSTPVTFDIATVDGTATGGSDFDAIALTGEAFAPGETARDYAVTVHGDTDLEADESFTLEVTNLVGATALDAQGQATILNDEATPLANGVPVPNLSGAMSSNQWFVLDVPAGVAELVIATTGGSGDMDLFVYRDSRTNQVCYGVSVRPSETCRFVRPPAGKYYIRLYGFSAFQGITLTGTYSLPTLSIDDLALVEGDAGTKVVSVVARLSHALTQAVTVDAQFSSGTATIGSDVVTTGVTGIQFAPGELVKVFQATIAGDTDVEPNEVFHITLVNPTGGAVLGDAVADATIVNNDGPTLSVGGVAVAEGNSGTKVATFTVRLSQAAAVPVTYSIDAVGGTATAGGDFTAASLSGETIPAGMLARTYAVTLNGDTAIEANESFTVRIGQATGATILQAQGAGTILNDDGPTLSVLDASVAEGSSGVRVMNVTVRLSQAATSWVYFTIATANGSATAGSDYAALYQYNAAIPVGQTSRTFQVDVTGDTVVEPNETIVVRLSNPSYATLYDPQAVATIYNDDGPTLSVNDVSISEGNAGTKVATFTVALSQVAAVPISYDIATSSVTATAGDDYVGQALAGETIPAGQLSKTFTVTLNGDTTVEANETFRVTLSNIGAGATLFKYTGTGTITNDD